MRHINSIIPCSFLQCSLTCGSGLRRRDVTCSRNTGVGCDPQKKPLDITTCNTEDCPRIVDNFGDVEWSGSGWSSKEVLNKINSVPKVKSVPKHSTTRAQPRRENLEGDFHYHNNIENTVQVDDFYYDYNFIKFHEDLSDDFESGGEDSGDSALQEDKPTDSTKENAFTETTRAPIASSAMYTISKATVYTLKTKETPSTDLDSVKDSEIPSTSAEQSMQTDSETVDDFLSEDFLLPVSSTKPPTLSTTQKSPTVKERHDDWWLPENIKTMPRLISTTEEPKNIMKILKDEINIFTQEESESKDLSATLNHATPLPEHQTIINTVTSTAVSIQETEEYDFYMYRYNEQSTLGLDISADRDEENQVQVTTEVQLDGSALKIPQTTSQPVIFPAAFTLQEEHLDQTNTVSFTNQGNSWDAEFHLSTTSLTASEKSTSLPLPFLQNSGNQVASDNASSLTGTKSIPPTATQASPADFLPATKEQMLSKFVSTGRTGTESTSLDYSEIVILLTEKSSITSDPDPSYQYPGSVATPHRSTLVRKHMESPTPTTILPTPVPTSVKTSVAAYWVTGNWSTVSLC